MPRTGPVVRLTGWLLWAVAVAGAWLNLLGQSSSSEALAVADPTARLSRVLYLGQPLLIATVAALIATRRPENPVGWLLLLGGTTMAVEGLAQTLTTWAPGDPSNDWANARPWAAWVSNWAWSPAETTLELALLLFPTGRPPSRRWWPIVGLITIAGTVFTVVAAFMPGPLDAAPAFDNPVGLGSPSAQALASLIGRVIGAGSAVMLAVAALSVVVRFWGARAEERQQLKWLAYALAIGASITVLNGFGAFGSWGNAASNLALSTVPVSVGLAMLRYRLYHIELLINRTLVYGVLSAAIAALYVAVVGLTGTALRSGGSADSWLPSLLLTGTVALVFQPLRDVVQRGVNRLLYGQRDDPYTAISQLGRRLESSARPEAVLSTIVQAVRDSLRLPYASVELTDGAGQPSIGRVVSGTPSADVLVVPLVYQRERLGELAVSPRSPGEALGAADQRLLGDLARQAGVAAHAVRLTAELQHSRERLVSAREEERRRLRRDLHDGLGPTLAALSLKLETARNRLGHDPAANELLGDLAARAQAAVVDIRRVVYGLRPPALDDLGLVEALRQQAAQHLGEGLMVRLEAPNDLPALPAAVEVAAYRIVVEALTNVARHAAAQYCTIRLTWAKDRLEVEVQDDGRGLAAGCPAGVGLASMRERAEELGGTLGIAAAPGGGTRVWASLPLVAQLGDGP